MSAKEELKYKKKKKLGSYPYLSVVFSITMALFVIGLFCLLMLHSRKLSEIIRKNVEVHVYLDKLISESNIIRLKNIIANSDYIDIENNQPQITFISKEEAASEFIASTGEDFTEFLGDNPLRDAYVIRINQDFQQKEALEKIKSQLERLEGVFEVVYMESLVDSINKNITKISIILVGFAGIMLLIIIILINNTIKLALFSQRFLIRSMQLVGARPGFIQKPFLGRSLFQGLVSGMIASGLLFGLLKYANTKIEDLAMLQDEIEIIIVFTFITILGGVIGFFSTYRSIHKYLKMTLDELY